MINSEKNQIKNKKLKSKIKNKNFLNSKKILFKNYLIADFDA